MSPDKSNFQDQVAPAFELQGKLNAVLTDKSVVWDKGFKTRVRKEVNRLKDMMQIVLDNKKDLLPELIDGLEEVIVNTEAKLDGKKMVFKADVIEEEEGSAPSTKTQIAA